MAPEVGPETKKPGKEHEVLEAFSLFFFFPSIHLKHLILQRSNFRLLITFGNLRIPIKISIVLSFWKCWNIVQLGF